MIQLSTKNHNNPEMGFIAAGYDLSTMYRQKIE